MRLSIADGVCGWTRFRACEEGITAVPFAVAEAPTDAISTWIMVRSPNCNLCCLDVRQFCLDSIADPFFSRGDMGTSDEFDEMAQACIDNHDEVMRHGSSEMQTASRMLLHALAEEIRRREQGDTAANDDRP